MFSIREMDLADSANFLGRADMWELAANSVYTRKKRAKTSLPPFRTENMPTSIILGAECGECFDCWLRLRIYLLLMVT